MTNVTTDAVLPDHTLEVRLVVLQVVHALVDEPQSVEMRCEELVGQTCFRVRVSASDIGKIIGKQGRTACSIRTILAAASMKTGHRYSSDIVQAE